jgi:hypothetical protein
LRNEVFAEIFDLVEIPAQAAVYRRLRVATIQLDPQIQAVLPIAIREFNQSHFECTKVRDRYCP